MTEVKNTRGRNEYMRDYMAKRRPLSQKALAERRGEQIFTLNAALATILDKLENTKSALGLEIKAIAEKAMQ